MRFIPPAATSCLNHNLFMQLFLVEVLTRAFTRAFCCRVGSDRVSIKLNDTSAHPEMRCNVARSKTRYTAEGHGLESRLLARPSRKNPKIARAKYMFLVTDRNPSNANLPYSTASIAFDACTEVGSTYQDSQTARTSQYYAKENDKMYRPFSHCLGETVSRLSDVPHTDADYLIQDALRYFFGVGTALAP